MELVERQQRDVGGMDGRRRDVWTLKGKFGKTSERVVRAWQSDTAGNLLTNADLGDADQLSDPVADQL